MLPFACFLNKGITSIENNWLIFKPCNCNFLPKLRSNDYRHEVEPDNSTRKETERKNHIAKGPQAPQRGRGGGRRICQLPHSTKLKICNSPTFSLGQWLRARRSDLLCCCAGEGLDGNSAQWHNIYSEGAKVLATSRKGGRERETAETRLEVQL